MGDLSGILSLCESNARIIYTQNARVVQIVSMRDVESRSTVASVIATTATGVEVLVKGPAATDTSAALNGLLNVLEISLADWVPEFQT